MTDRTSLIVTVSTITAALVAVVPGATDICAQAPAVDGHEIGRRAIAYRQSIKSGVVEIDSSLKKRGKDAKNAVYRISFDGDKCRVVATHKYDGDWKKGETYQRTFVFAGDGKVLEFSDEQLADGGVLAGAIRRDSEIARRRAAPDPRLIGTLPSLFLNLYHRSLSSVFDNPEWNVVGFAPDMINGRECLRVSYARVGATTGGSGVKVDFWVDLARNANVIRSVIAGREVVERIDCDLGMVEGAGWFPCETQYSLYEKGILTEEEITRVRVIQFNKNVPPDEFSVASLGVPDGRDVIDTSVSPAKHFIMDKGNLVDAAVHGAYQANERPSRSGRVWLVCGVLTGAFALWFLWRRPDRVKGRKEDGGRVTGTRPG